MSPKLIVCQMKKSLTVCSEISDAVSSIEEDGNKLKESNAFVSKDGSQWNRIPFLLTKTKDCNVVKTKL